MITINASSEPHHAPFKFSLSASDGPAVFRHGRVAELPILSDILPFYQLQFEQNCLFSLATFGPQILCLSAENLVTACYRLQSRCFKQTFTESNAS